MSASAPHYQSMTIAIIDASGLRRTARLAGRAAMDYVHLGKRVGSSELPVVESLDHIAEDLLALSSHLSLLATALEQGSSRFLTTLAERSRAS